MPRARIERSGFHGPSEWYRHASLEAGDTLKEELESDLLDLERGLSSASFALDAMSRLDESSSATERRLAERGFQKALLELELASLPLDRNLKRRLETLARERKVRKLDKEELERLRAPAGRRPRGSLGAVSRERHLSISELTCSRRSARVSGRRPGGACRVVAAVVRAGHVAIFDRSWYGRVLVERVEGFASETEWKRAYAEINDFEEQLANRGMLVLKFWIHISQEEQLRRFKAREKVPFRKYKITSDDYRNREQWNDCELAASEMLMRTSTDHAPWRLIPGNDKRVARIEVLKAVCRALKKILVR